MITEIKSKLMPIKEERKRGILKSIMRKTRNVCDVQLNA